MGRYSKDFAMQGTPAEMYGRLKEYLFSQGYTETDYKGDRVLKKPDTFSTGPIFFKVTFLAGNRMRIESWMKQALLPGGGYVGEIAPGDFRGWAVKGPWKECLAHIEQMFSTPQSWIPSQSGEANAFCTACGTRRTPGNAFCGKCGHRF